MMIQGYINLVIIFIAVTAALYLTISLISKSSDRGFIRSSSYLLCFWSFSFIIFATVILFNLPLDFNSGRYILNLQPMQWLWEGTLDPTIITETILNIMLFIPLGFFLPIAFKTMRKFYMTALAAFVVTFSIEFFQYFIGRVSDIDDLIQNVLGGIIGYGIFKLCSFVFSNRTLWNKFAPT